MADCAESPFGQGSNLASFDRGATAMRIVLLGASGYLAGHVTRQLIIGDHFVHGYYRREPAVRLPNAVRIVSSTADLSAAILEDQPQLVINMANVYTRQGDFDSLQKLIDVNSRLMSTVAETCLQVCARLLHIGSAWQADLSVGSLGLPEAPIYSLQRGIASSIGRWYRVHRELSFAEIAIADTYGPGDSRGKVVTRLIDAARAGQTQLSIGSQDPTLYPVHVQDVSQCIATAATFDFSEWESPWLCAWEPGMSVSQLVTVVNELYGSELVPEFGDGERRPRLDSTKFSYLPGWKPLLSPREGILRIQKDES